VTKDELIEAVDLIYAMWNKDLPTLPDQQKNMYRAWSRLILDCPKNDILQAADRLALTHPYLPTPGTIRAEYNRIQPGSSPSPSQAWNQYTQIRDAINSGNQSPIQPHPKLAATIRQTGLNLHTNDDRKHFTQTYNDTTVEETP